MAVLILDSDLGFVFWLGQILIAAAYEALPARSVPDATVLLANLKVEIDLLVVNSSLPGTADFVENLRRFQAHLKVIRVLEPSDEPAENALRADVSIRKPYVPDNISREVWLQVIQRVSAFPAFSQ